MCLHAFSLTLDFRRNLPYHLTRCTTCMMLAIGMGCLLLDRASSAALELKAYRLP